MKKAKAITTKEELLDALIDMVSQSLNMRQPGDFTLSEFIARYEQKTGVQITHDRAYKMLKREGYSNSRVGRNEYVWRKS